jgi:protein SCO1/2
MKHRAMQVRAGLLALGAVALTTHALGQVADPKSPAHADHHLVVQAGALQRTRVSYQMPDLHLVRDDGVPVALAAELDDGRPVYVDFIYTTCTAICPVTSATFAALQEKLGRDRDKVRLLSISIDPEEDTPRRLEEFRRKYGAGPQWRCYTGTAEASIATQRAFGVFTGDKMGHTPVTLFRAANGQQWVRLDGFATPDELLREYRAAIARK